MNRLVVSIILLVVLTAISFGSLSAVDIVTDKMLQLVDDVEAAYQIGDNERSCDSAEELEEIWEEFMETREEVLQNFFRLQSIAV